MSKIYFYSYHGYAESILVVHGSGTFDIKEPVDKEELLQDVLELALKHAKRDIPNVDTVHLLALNEV